MGLTIVKWIKNKFLKNIYSFDWSCRVECAVFPGKNIYRRSLTYYHTPSLCLNRISYFLVTAQVKIRVIYIYIFLHFPQSKIENLFHNWCVFVKLCLLRLNSRAYTTNWVCFSSLYYHFISPSEMKRNGAYRFLSVFSCFLVCVFLFLFWFFVFYSMVLAP